MKLDPNNPRSFYMTEEENQEVFKKEVLPKLKKRFDLTKSNNPIVYLTAGLPGAGKSFLVESMIEETKNGKTFIANSDEMRPYHPKYDVAIEMFGSEAGAAVHKDASIFSEKSIQYAIEQKATFIIDGTMRDPKKAEELISSLQSNNYTIKVTLIAVNEYESLHGVFNRYATQYEFNPATARFVNPKYIEEGKLTILESAKMIHNKNIDEFKVVDRDHTVLYNSKIDYTQTPSTIIKNSIDIKNWKETKIDQLKENWNQVIVSLEKAKVPNNVLEKAKIIKAKISNLNPLDVEIPQKSDKSDLKAISEELGRTNQVKQYDKTMLFENLDKFAKEDLTQDFVKLVKEKGTYKEPSKLNRLKETEVTLKLNDLKQFMQKLEDTQKLKEKLLESAKELMNKFEKPLNAIKSYVYDHFIKPRAEEKMKERQKERTLEREQSKDRGMEK